MKPGDRVIYFKRNGIYSAHSKHEAELLKLTSTRAIIRLVETGQKRCVNRESIDKPRRHLCINSNS